MGFIINETKLKNIVNSIQNAQAKFQTVKVKWSKTKATERLFDTLSSLSNQDDGGIIVLIMYESEGFTVTGVDDDQELQKSVINQWVQMEPPERAVFTVVEIDEKMVFGGDITDWHNGTYECNKEKQAHTCSGVSVWTLFPCVFS